MQQLSFDAASVSPDGLLVEDVLKRIAETSHKAVEKQYRILNEDLFPVLAAENIRFLKRDELNEAQSLLGKTLFS